MIKHNRKQQCITVFNHTDIVYGTTKLNKGFKFTPGKSFSVLQFRAFHRYVLITFGYTFENGY